MTERNREINTSSEELDPAGSRSPLEMFQLKRECFASKIISSWMNSSLPFDLSNSNISGDSWVSGYCPSKQPQRSLAGSGWQRVWEPLENTDDRPCDSPAAAGDCPPLLNLTPQLPQDLCLAPEKCKPSYSPLSQRQLSPGQQSLGTISHERRQELSPYIHLLAPEHLRMF